MSDEQQSGGIEFGEKYDEFNELVSKSKKENQQAMDRLAQALFNWYKWSIGDVNGPSANLLQSHIKETLKNVPIKVKVRYLEHFKNEWEQQ
jgi:hypothetical protein